MTTSTAPPIRTYSYNLCGAGGAANCDVSSTGNQARYDTIVKETTGGVWNADYIFLVEICSYQFNDLNALLSPRGYKGRYVETVAAGGLVSTACVDTGGSTARSYGMALFVRGTSVDGTNLVLDTKDGILETVKGTPRQSVYAENIISPCLKVWVQNRPTWACSVHLWWGTPSMPNAPQYPQDPTPANLEDYRKKVEDYNDSVNRYKVMAREADLLAAQAKAWEDEGVPVVLGGDFNSSTWGDVLDRFYEAGAGQGAYGGFVEADETDSSEYGRGSPSCAVTAPRCRSGELTKLDAVTRKHTHKLDYTFFSSRYFRGVVGDVPAEPRTSADKAVSDHLPLRAAANWADCGTYDATAGSLLRRDAAGGLYRYRSSAGGDGAVLAKPCKVGTGWQTSDNPLSIKHAARKGSTVVAVDGAGSLWHYSADPVDGTYSGGAGRTQAGSGFQYADLLLSPGDFDGDGRADLITRDSTGGLWLHRGSGANSYAAREQIPSTATDWMMYSSVAAGDFAEKAGATSTPDLIAVDEVGSLWLYEGNADGTLAERRNIGFGWGIYDTVVAPGDLNNDGNADIVGREDGGDLYFYKGDGAGGYAPRVRIGSSFPAGELLF